jgi:hypothetical protein
VEAPQDSHPDCLKKSGTSKVNLTQRTAHESKEIAEDTEEYTILKGIMEDAMEFIRANVRIVCFINLYSNYFFVSCNINFQRYMRNSVSTARYSPSIPTHQPILFLDLF